MVRCPRDFRAICTAVAPDAVGTLRIYNPTPPVYDGHFVPCSSDHNRAIMPNCELQPRELLKNVPTRVADPPGGLTSYRDACRRALTRQKRGPLDVTWDDDVLTTQSENPADPLPSDPQWSGHTVYTDEREREGSAPVERVWQVIETIGGQHGWYSAPMLWKVRGLMDQALGGYGLAWGRKDEYELHVNVHVDWWRVGSVELGRMVALRAEMRAGGRAWLQFRVEPLNDGGTRLYQRAVFFPNGLIGRGYWRIIQPFHALIFPTMAKNILQAAQQQDVS